VDRTVFIITETNAVLERSPYKYKGKYFIYEITEKLSMFFLKVKTYEEQ
jgi:hypothetical protein